MHAQSQGDRSRANNKSFEKYTTKEDNRYDIVRLIKIHMEIY